MNATAEIPTVVTAPPARKPLKPVSPTIVLLDYSTTTGRGAIAIDGTVYAMSRIMDGTRKTGLRLDYVRESVIDGMPESVHYNIDLTVNPPVCDCADATYRSERPGGCKHVHAVRHAAAILRAAASKGERF